MFRLQRRRLLPVGVRHKSFILRGAFVKGTLSRLFLFLLAAEGFNVLMNVVVEEENMFRGFGIGNGN